VIFVGTVPEHEHIYSNGYICLATLYDGTFLIISIVKIGNLNIHVMLFVWAFLRCYHKQLRRFMKF
jgi:hypothetical protein